MPENASPASTVREGDGPGLRYRDTGVDLEAADRAKERLRALIDATRDEHTLSQAGAFGGLYSVPPGAQPVLVSSADGVGTKLKVAFLAGRHDTVGQDLVNHCVDDILVQGARPLFFLDYLATGRLDPTVVTDVVSGVATACRENGCVLLGGETAEMPDFYAPGEYDLAGFVVGLVERDSILDGSRVRAGDALIGLPSSGLHTNGFTLARSIVFERMGLTVEDELPETGTTVAESLLSIHRSYLPVLEPLLGDAGLRALAHITGGGFPGNLPRILPPGLGAVVDRSAWTPPVIFRVLQEAGPVESDEMFRVFNMGIGMVAVAGKDDVDRIVGALEERGEEAVVVGRVEEGEGVRYA